MNHIICTISFFLLIHTVAESQMRVLYADGTNTSNSVKKLSFYSATTGYLAMVDQYQPLVAFTSDSGNNFIKRTIRLNNVNFNGYSVNLTFGFAINGVKAFDQNHLVVYGDYGLVPAILYSSDGGLTYTLIYQYQFSVVPSSSVMDMVFPQNDNTGFAVTADQVLKTTDKGITWVPVKTVAGAKFKYLEATDNNTVFAFSTINGTGIIIKTADGGLNWQPVIIPAGQAPLYLNFISPSAGWLVTQDSVSQAGKVFYTANGGALWQLKNDPDITPFYCTKMKFINDSTGYAVAGYTTFKTTDSGKVWEPIPRDNNFSYLGYAFTDIQFAGTNQFWSAGELEFLEINTNPGASPLPRAFFAIDTSGVSTSRNVQLINYSKKNYSYQWYVNNSLISTAYNTSYIHDVYHPNDTIKLVVKNGTYTDSLIKYQYYGPVPNPYLTSFTPASGTAGSVITIKGQYLQKTTGVSFGTVPAKSFTIISDSVLTAVVDDGATGSITVSAARATVSINGFTFIPPAPFITSITPATATPGSVISIAGNFFSNTGTVSFGGVAAVSFTVVSQKLIKAVVGNGSSGIVSVTTPMGTGTITGFTLLPLVSINSFSPVSGVVGSTVTIYGDNFSLTPANNIVYFGSVAATVVTASANQLTVLVPAGATNQHITVTVNGQSAESGFSFLPTFTGGEHITTGTFTEVVTYGVNYDYNGYSFLADLDKDGKLDLIAGKGSVFRNNSTLGNISFAGRQDIFSSLSSPYFPIVKDIDGDGLADMVINSIGLKIARNTSTPGNISFDSPLSFSLTGGGLASADLDGDNRPDVAMVGQYSVFISRNTSQSGAISFEDYVEFATGDSPWELTFTDLDGDHKPEMIISNYYSGNIGVYHNISSPGKIDFEAPAYIPLDGVTTGLAYSDLDGDGKTDLIIARRSNSNNSTEYVSVLRNTSTGAGNISFDSKFDIMNHAPYELQIADLNGDGKPDIVSSNPSYHYISVFENTGTTGSLAFASPVNLSTGPYGYPTYAPLGDLDNDGKPDIVYNNYNVNSVTIFRNGSGEHYAQAGRDTVLCTTGASVQLGAPAVAGYTYVWSSVPAGFTSTIAMPIVTPAATTKYFLSVTLPNGIHSTDSVTVTIQNLVANAGNDASLCEGTGTQIGSYPISGVTYFWTSIPAGFTSAEASPLAFPSVTTKYCLKITGATGCTAYDTATLTVIPVTQATVTITGNTTVTTGQSSSITATPVNGGNSPWYVWQDSTSSHAWQDLNTNNGPVISYTPQQSGDKLRCRMSTSKPCASPGTATSNSMTFIVNSVTAVDPLSANTHLIKLYPNPVKEILIADSLRIMDDWQTIEIIAVNGKQIMAPVSIKNQTKVFISTASFQNGMYTAILHRKHGPPVMIKFIKL